MTTNNNKYGYYLANGSYVEYYLSPDSNLLTVISELAESYLAAGGTNCDIWMLPKYVSSLQKELFAKTRVMSGYPLTLDTQIRISLVSGTVSIRPERNLFLPIFMGSEDEMRENNLNALMEEVLK